MSAGNQMDRLAVVKVLVADDHPIILEGVGLALSKFSDIQVIAQARNSTELIDILRNAPPCDVIVTDLAMPGGQYGDGLPFIDYLQRHFNNISIVVLTMLENPPLLKRLVEFGVNGIVSKSDDLNHIGQAVRAVTSGLIYHSPSIREALSTPKINAFKNAQVMLSTRELEVVRLFVTGLTITAIAEQLKRSVKTISAQKNTAMRKLGLGRDSELFLYAQNNGLMNLPSADIDGRASR